MSQLGPTSQTDTCCIYLLLWFNFHWSPPSSKKLANSKETNDAGAELTKRFRVHKLFQYIPYQSHTELVGDIRILIYFRLDQLCWRIMHIYESRIEEHSDCTWRYVSCWWESTSIEPRSRYWSQLSHTRYDLDIKAEVPHYPCHVQLSREVFVPLHNIMSHSFYKNMSRFIGVVRMKQELMFLYRYNMMVRVYLRLVSYLV